MYKNTRRITALLYIGGGIEFGTCLALIEIIIWALELRTEYRNFCFEINDVILASASEGRSISRGSASWPLDEKTLSYYEQNMLGRNTLVFNRKLAPLDDRSIILNLGPGQLCFTGQEDDSAINIRWETPDQIRSYTVRSSDVTFRQFSAYLSNYIRALE